MPTPVILITGHPATGKTTLARFLARALGLPLVCKDDIKECLFETLGWQDAGLAQRLAGATWELLYLHVEQLLAARVATIVESNFDPQFANAHWRRLSERYPLRVVQIRCECAPDILLARYQARIDQGQRHPGHADAGNQARFQRAIQAGPLEWIDIPCRKLAVDTTVVSTEQYPQLAVRLQQELRGPDLTGG